MRFIVRVLTKLGWIKYVNLQYKLSYKGNTFRVPVIHGMGRENMNLTETWMIDVLSHLLSLKKGAIIDVGVNVGQTLIKIRSVDKEVKYIGFEPNPTCVYYAHELIKANSFKNTTVVPAGIADQDHLLVLNFYSDGDLDSSASIVKDFRPQQIYRKEYVACLQYNAFAELIDHEPVSIVKIDVEGAELEVLKSLSVVLKDKRPFVLVEILPAYSIENTGRVTRQKEILEMMKKLDYKILRINKTKRGYTKLDQIEINPKIEDCDYLLCPAETVSSIDAD